MTISIRPNGDSTFTILERDPKTKKECGRVTINSRMELKEFAALIKQVVRTEKATTFEDAEKARSNRHHKWRIELERVEASSGLKTLIAEMISWID